MNDSRAAVGSVVELEGVLRADGDARSGAIVRFEHLCAFDEGHIEHRKTQWLRRGAVLELSDGTRVALELDDLSWRGVVPSRRLRARWSAVVSECSLLPADMFADGDALVELRVGSIDEGARVRVRGVVRDVRSSAEKSQGFREIASPSVSRLRVSHVASGPDPKRALELALEGFSQDARSSLYDGARRPWVALALAGASALVALLVRESPVWFAQSVMMAASFVAIAGAFFAETGRLLWLQWLNAPKSHERDVSRGTGLAVVIAGLGALGAAMYWGLSLSARRSTGTDSLAGILILWSLGVGVASTLYALVMLRALAPHAEKLLRGTRASTKASGVLAGRIVDPTPVDSSIGPAAIVAITEEEVVRGSDPNITTHQLLVDDGFSLRSQDIEVMVDPRATQWATTVHLSETSGRRSDRTVIVHSAIVPLGAPALAWGQIRETTRGPLLSDAEGSAPLLLVCHGSEDPRRELRVVLQRTQIGLALSVVASLAVVLTMVVA